jgi:hypothetical protein
MAKGDQNGALGSLTEEQFGSLSRGFEMSNPVATLGGIGVTKGSVPSYGLGVLGLSTTPVGIANTAIDAYGKYSAEKAAQAAFGQNRGFIDTVTGMVTNPAMDTARSMADTNKDGKVSQREAQNFGMQQGKLTSYQVGLNPAYGYTPNTVSIQGLTAFGKSTPTTGTVQTMEAPSKGVDQFGFSTNPFSYTVEQARGIAQDTQTGVGRGIDTVGLGGAKGAGYKGSVGNAFGFGKTEGVDTSDPNSTGASTGVGGSAAGVGGMSGGSTSSSATAGTTSGTSYADDAQGSGGGPGGGTYICTALYEMGDMKKYIYKYDQIYGKRVDPLVYKGYCVWGEYVATKMRKKGLVYKIAKPLALAWAKQMAYDLSNGRYGKKSKVVKVISKVGEGICYALGFVSNVKQLIGEKYG